MCLLVDKGGRPKRVLNAEEIEEVGTLAAVLNIEQISDYFGISSTTFNEIKNRQPEVSVAYKRGKAKAIQLVAGSLLSNAKEGNTTAQIFYLKTQAGWSETAASGDDDDEAQPMDISYNVTPAKGDVKTTNAKP